MTRAERQDRRWLYTCGYLYGIIHDPKEKPERREIATRALAVMEEYR